MKYPAIKFLQLLPALLSSALVHADERTADYTLRWVPVAGEVGDSTGEDSLYRLNVQHRSQARTASEDFRITPLPEGLSWSTRIRLRDTADFSESDERPAADYSMVSRQYRIGYSAQHQGVDLAFEQFESDGLQKTDDFWALGFSTGGRLPLSSWGVGAPLWRLSLQGEYQQYSIENTSFDGWINRGDWYLTPSLHWSTNSFSLSAGIQLPLDRWSRELVGEEPDYRIHADFKQWF